VASVPIQPDAEPWRSLPAGALHLWRADLEAVPDQLTELLSPAERDRAAAILPPSRRTLWPRSRAVLRLLLGLYADCAPQRLALTAGASGKPELAGAGAEGRAGAEAGGRAGAGAGVGGHAGPGVGAGALHFNLSHSGPVALYALSAAGPVGVDVEVGPRARPSLDELALARRAFGAAETARLERLQGTARARGFLRAWTRHEAALKCVGAPSESEPAPVWTADLDLDLGIAAVALAEVPREVRCYRWPPAQGGLGEIEVG
jgi:4'-phosphopantetheinyl transferase